MVSALQGREGQKTEKQGFQVGHYFIVVGFINRVLKACPKLSLSLLRTSKSRQSCTESLSWAFCSSVFPLHSLLMPGTIVWFYNSYLYLGKEGSHKNFNMKTNTEEISNSKIIILGPTIKAYISYFIYLILYGETVVTIHILNS